MDVLTSEYSAADVVRAAKVSGETLQNWLKRGVIVGHRDGRSEITGGGGQGRHRRFSFFSVMEIASARALVSSCGVDLHQAIVAAADFAHSGHGPFDDKPGRLPGFPFPPALGQTYLVCGGGGSDVILDRRDGQVLDLVRVVLRNPAAFVMLDATALFDQVVAALGHHPQAALDTAYAAHVELAGPAAEELHPETIAKAYETVKS